MPPRVSSATRILIVEDDPGIRDVVAFHLGLARYDITTAEDGKAALVLLQSKPFDVVVLDLASEGGHAHARTLSRLGWAGVTKPRQRRANRRLAPSSARVRKKARYSWRSATTGSTRAAQYAGR